ncbi:MAG: hypothetical protein NTZ56_22480 [Acidobacteria bacterium]|nr:hypothetical protein [Acidobacteriota bacterium]
MLTRRAFPGICATALGSGATVIAAPAAPARPRVAAVVTEYRYYSHADVVCGRIFDGYAVNGKRQAPRTEIVSMFTAQTPENDMARELCSRHGIPLYKTIREALTLGGSKLAVDAVVFIGEHGNYPMNELGQKLYPRFELFSEVLAVYRDSGRSVPTFFDKHLSYSWEKAKKLYDEAAALKVPWFAGSSLPVTVRIPDVSLPVGVEFEDACVIGFGDADAYGFHLLEVLQCMVERRKGGETGVAAVRMVEGPEAAPDKDPLAEEAMARQPGRRTNMLTRQPVRFDIEYRDGLKTRVYILNGAVQHFTFAARVRGQLKPLSCLFNMSHETRPLPHFDGLVSRIEEMFVTGRPPYPVERTLLTTGILAHLFDSKLKRYQRIETPALEIRYAPPKDGWHQSA